MALEPQKINDLLQEARAELMALPFASLERPIISRERALYLTRALLREMKPLLSALGDELSSERARAREADYDGLLGRAYVFYAADMAVEAPWTPQKKARRRELVRKVREHDRHLSSWAIPIFRKDAKARGIVAAILRGQGLRDDADDTLKLVALFRRYWPDVKSKIPLSAVDLNEAEADANELIQVLDVIESDQSGSPRDLRKRAFTAWLTSYNELFHAGRFLLRADPAAAERLPKVSAERAGGEEEAEDEAESSVDEGAGSSSNDASIDDGPKTDRDGEPKEPNES